MRRAFVAVALALGLWHPVHAQEAADALLLGSFLVAPPLDGLGRVSLQIRPQGDPANEFGIEFNNSGLFADKPDVRTAQEKAWVFTKRLAPGRYEVVRFRICSNSPSTSVGSFSLGPRRNSCRDIDGDQPVLLDVKAGATIYIGRWHLALGPRQPPEPMFTWGPSGAYLRDTYDEDMALLAARKPGQAYKAVENPIAVLVRPAAKP